MKKIVAMVLVITLLVVSLVSLGLAESKPYEGVTLSWLIPGGGSREAFQAVADAAEAKLGLKVEIEEAPAGAEGDTVIKTRLSSGEMSDLLYYNSGSLLQALNPKDYFVDLSEKADLFDNSFVNAASVDGILYGVPAETTQAGAVVYNQKMYDKYNLEIPLTWADFLANCEVLKQAGEIPVVSASADSWTTQVTYLGDHYNVSANDPDFTANFQAGKAKYATHKQGLMSFQKMYDLIPYINEDHMATTFNDAVDMLFGGTACHWIMLTGIFNTGYEMYGDEVNNFGVFGIPGETADVNGLTVWPSNGVYVNKDGENVEASLAFVDFYTTKEGLDAFASVNKPNGPFHVKGYVMPADTYTCVKQMQELYFETGKTAIALEFETSVKGPNCPAICQEIISGQTTAAEAAAKYDEDCKKQAVQIGLDWE